MATVADCCRVSSSLSSCSFDSGCVDPASPLNRLLESFGFFLDADTGVDVDVAGTGADCSLAATAMVFAFDEGFQTGVGLSITIASVVDVGSGADDVG